MRTIFLTAIMAVVFADLTANSQSLIASDEAINDSLTVLSQGIQLASTQLEQAQNKPQPSTAAARKERLRSLYELRRDLAAAELEYYQFCMRHISEGSFEDKAIFGRLARRAKRKKDFCQGKVYALAEGSPPSVQR